MDAALERTIASSILGSCHPYTGESGVLIVAGPGGRKFNQSTSLAPLKRMDGFRSIYRDSAGGGAVHEGVTLGR